MGAYFLLSFAFLTVCTVRLENSVHKRTCASTEYANHLRINQHQDTVLHSMVVVMLLFTFYASTRRELIVVVVDVAPPPITPVKTQLDNCLTENNRM